MREKTLQNANWVCTPCGIKYGKQIPECSTYHMGICDVCGKELAITQPRDFGYLSKSNQDPKRIIPTLHPTFTSF